MLPRGRSSTSCNKRRREGQNFQPLHQDRLQPHERHWLPSRTFNHPRSKGTSPFSQLVSTLHSYTHPVDEVPEMRVERRREREAAPRDSRLGLGRVLHEERHRLIHPVQRAATQRNSQKIRAISMWRNRRTKITKSGRKTEDIRPARPDLITKLQQ